MSRKKKDERRKKISSVPAEVRSIIDAVLGRLASGKSLRRIRRNAYVAWVDAGRPIDVAKFAVARRQKVERAQQISLTEPNRAASNDDYYLAEAALKSLARREIDCHEAEMVFEELPGNMF